MTYRTFKRSCTNWHEFGTAPKEEQETGLSLNEAKISCNAFNGNRSDAEIEAGTKMEFTEE